MKRQRLTPREREAIYKAQRAVCACGCGQPLTSGPIEEEHTQPRSLPGGEAKPDALMLRDCHKHKTRRDRARMAKLDRLLGKTRSQWHGTNYHKRRLANRSLCNALWRRKMNGEVVPR